MVIGLLTLAAIPTTIGVAEGVSHQRRQDREDADESRTAKFHLDVYCDAKSSKRDQVHGKRVVLRDDKVPTPIPAPLFFRLPSISPPSEPLRTDRQTDRPTDRLTACRSTSTSPTPQNAHAPPTRSRPSTSRTRTTNARARSASSAPSPTTRRC